MSYDDQFEWQPDPQAPQGYIPPQGQYPQPIQPGYVQPSGNYVDPMGVLRFDFSEATPVAELGDLIPAGQYPVTVTAADVRLAGKPEAPTVFLDVTLLIEGSNTPSEGETYIDNWMMPSKAYPQYYNKNLGRLQQKLEVLLGIVVTGDYQINPEELKWKRAVVDIEVYQRPKLDAARKQIIGPDGKPQFWDAENRIFKPWHPLATSAAMQPQAFPMPNVAMAAPPVAVPVAPPAAPQPVSAPQEARTAPQVPVQAPTAQPPSPAPPAPVDTLQGNVPETPVANGSNNASEANPNETWEMPNFEL